MTKNTFDVMAAIAGIQANTLQKEMVKAINTTTVGAVIQGLAKIENREVDVLFVYGRATGVKLGTDERKKAGTGDWSALAGQFWAIKVDEPGKVYESGRLFLPAGQDMLESLILTGELNTKNEPVYGRVEFAIMLVSQPANNAHGYRWKLRNMIDAGPPEETSVDMQILRRVAAQSAKALPAPDAKDKAKT